MRDVPDDLMLHDGTRVGVVGGGPAGAFFSYFLLEMAQNVGVDVKLDIYEPRDFSQPGPAGCNMCGGVISESLVLALAAEGIHLPSSVIQRTIDSYVLHLKEGSVLIKMPAREKLNEALALFTRLQLTAEQAKVQAALAQINE